MPRIKGSSPLSKTPTSLKLTPELEALISTAADRLDRPKQEVIRLALEVGMERIKRINYDIAGAIEDAAEAVDVAASQLVTLPAPVTGSASPAVPAGKAKRG